MPKKNLNFLEMLIFVKKKKRERETHTWRYKKKNKISGESRNILCKIKLSSFLVPFLVKFFASLYR